VRIGLGLVVVMRVAARAPRQYKRQRSESDEGEEAMRRSACEGSSSLSVRVAENIVTVAEKPCKPIQRMIFSDVTTSSRLYW
jgi:hypothetical protein